MRKILLIRPASSIAITSIPIGLLYLAAYSKNKGDYENGVFYGLDRLEQIFAIEGPVIVNCICLENQEILPSQALKNGEQAGLHDMAPFLSDEELKEEMVVTLWELSC